jgi:hypothetical protein
MLLKATWGKNSAEELPKWRQRKLICFLSKVGLEEENIFYFPDD